MTNDSIRKQVISTVAESLALLEVYASPSHEYSNMKRLPNTPEFHAKVDCLKQFGLKVIKRYRGPRRKNVYGRTTYLGGLACLKKDATHFSVYIRQK